MNPRRGNGSNVHPAHHCLQARLQFWEHGQMRAVGCGTSPFDFFFLGSLSSRPAAAAAAAAGNIIAVSHDPSMVSLIRLRTSREISSRKAHHHRQSPLPSQSYSDLSLNQASPAPPYPVPNTGWPFWNSNSNKVAVPRPRASCPPCLEQHTRLMLCSTTLRFNTPSTLVCMACLALALPQRTRSGSTNTSEG